MRWRPADRYSTLSCTRHVNHHRWSKNWWWLWLANFPISKTTSNLRINHASPNPSSFQSIIKSSSLLHITHFQFIILIVVATDRKTSTSKNIKQLNHHVIRLKDASKWEDEISISENIKQSNYHVIRSKGANEREGEISISKNIKQSNNERNLLSGIDLSMRVNQSGSQESATQTCSYFPPLLSP